MDFDLFFNAATPLFITATPLFITGTPPYVAHTTPPASIQVLNKEEGNMYCKAMKRDVKGFDCDATKIKKKPKIEQRIIVSG